MLSDAHALGQDDAEAVEQRGLGGVGLGDTAQADLAVRCGRQHDIVRLDAGKLFEDRARRVAEAGALLPHLEAALSRRLGTCDPGGGSVARRMKKIDYDGYRFPPTIIQQAIWLYFRFTLSFRDVEDVVDDGVSGEKLLR